MNKILWIKSYDQSQVRTPQLEQYMVENNIPVYGDFWSFKYSKTTGFLLKQGELWYNDEKVNLSEVACAIFFFVPPYTPQHELNYLIVLEQFFDNHDIPVYNRPTKGIFAANKLAFFNKISDTCQTPAYQAVRNINDTPYFNYPALVRSAEDGVRRYTYYVDNDNDFKYTVKKLLPLNKSIITTQYIEHSAVHRIAMIGNYCDFIYPVVSTEKIKGMTNISKDKSIIQKHAINPSSYQISRIYEAQELIGLDTVGFDVIFTADDVIFLEANLSLGLSPQFLDFFREMELDWFIKYKQYNDTVLKLTSYMETNNGR